MKKILTLVGMVILFSFVIAIFIGCLGADEDTYTEISSFEELKNTRGNIKLTCDIDGGYETIDSIYLSNLDGDGHTIRNIVIHTTANTETASLFYGASVIENLNLDNITVIGDSNLSAAIVTAGNCERIENVHVKNSSVTCTQTIMGSGLGRGDKELYVGGIFAGQFRSVDNGKAELDFECQIINCSLYNTTIEAIGLKGSSMEDVFAGGIAGASNHIEKCKVVDSEINCFYNGVYGEPYAAGIVACAEGKVLQSYVQDTKVNAHATYYQDNILSMYATPTAFVASIVAKDGKNGDIKYCYAQNNTLFAKCSGSLRIGGIIASCSGKVSQSYVTGSIMSSDGYTEGNQNDVERYIGGIAGKLSGNLTSCFAYSNNISDTTISVREKNSCAGGLVAFATAEASTSFTATYKNKIHAQSVDEFIPNIIENILDCYVTSDENGNINNVKLCDELFWIDSNAISEQLMLSGGFWKFENGKIPYLSLD